MFNVLKRLNLSDRWDCLVMAMSADKQKIKKTMENFLDKYEEHIGKYILYNNYQNGINNNGWIREIFKKYLNRIQHLTFKSSHKRPDKNFLKQWFFTVNLDSKESFEAYLDALEYDLMTKKEEPFPERTRKVDIKKTYEAYRKFIDICSSYMEKGALTEEILKKEIKKLIV